MEVDVRWVVFCVLVAGTIWLTYRRERWGTPIVVGMAVAAVALAVMRL